ncbi:MAG: hypothetical protein MR482_07995, partial [Selenomonadales bacterium]|nr:hypothetical protein [Selenomonadales bacterium]
PHITQVLLGILAAVANYRTISLHLVTFFNRASDTIPDNQICEQKADRHAPKYIEECPNCHGSGEK